MLEKKGADILIKDCAEDLSWKGSVANMIAEMDTILMVYVSTTTIKDAGTAGKVVGICTLKSKPHKN